MTDASSDPTPPGIYALRRRALSSARRAARRLGFDVVRYPAASDSRPFDFATRQVEHRLHEYLGVERDAVGTIVIVGAWLGHEVAGLLDRYPSARLVCLEPNPAVFARLAAVYAKHPRVTLIEAAALDETGEQELVDVGRSDAGSLLERDSADTRFARLGSVTVPVVRLDDLDLGDVDCLWIDVQGVEDRVLRGADRLLDRTRAVLAEIALDRSPHVGGCLYPDVAALLEPRGFDLVALGASPWNGEGNALWRKR